MVNAFSVVCAVSVVNVVSVVNAVSVEKVPCPCCVSPFQVYQSVADEGYGSYI